MVYLPYYILDGKDPAMKAIRILILSAALTLLLAACGKQSPATETTASSHTDATTAEVVATTTEVTTTEATTTVTEETAPPEVIPMPSHDIAQMPRHINGGAWDTSHVQGMAIDTQRQYMYFSFTQMLVKTDMKGNIIGTVTGLTGHLGDLDFNDIDGRVYGSLEYKSQNAFYIAIFDVDKITRMDMSAEKDGIMTAVYLPDVVEDFTAVVGTSKTQYRYGCSGIDGVAFGPTFGKDASEPFSLMVAYGIFSDTARVDNDYQVILEFDWRAMEAYEKPLKQSAPHREGPTAKERYFAYTGNTNYGVQNLEYDMSTGNWLMAVYTGKKSTFPNLPLYIVDGSIAPVMGDILGQPTPEQGLLLTLAKGAITHKASGISGWTFGYGDTGLIALDDGYFYVSHNSKKDGKQTCDAYLYRWTGKGTGFEQVK
jgi:hypothetical protein